MTPKRLAEIKAEAEEWRRNDIIGHPTPLNETILELVAEVERLNNYVIGGHKQIETERAAYIERLEARLREALCEEHYRFEQYNPPNNLKSQDEYVDAEMAKLRDQPTLTRTKS